ncbi:MAG: alpha-L-fucosidase, partial [Pirellulales bacterium]
DRDAYSLRYKEQLRELLTAYGEIVVVWLDNYLDPFRGGVIDPKTGKAADSKFDQEVHALIRSLHPGAVIMHSDCSSVGTDVLHSGSERGVASYPLWNAVRPGQVRKGMLPWRLVEANIYTRPKWIWTPNSDDKILSVERLMQAYYESIGRGSNLLVNLTPDPRGIIPDAEVKRMEDFGAEIKRRLGKPIATTTSRLGWSSPGVLELDLVQAASIRHIVLEEEIAHGQHVLVYEIDAFDGSNWKTVAKGESIGRKRIERLASPAIARRIRLRVLKANAVPMIRDFSVYAPAK